MPASAAAKNEQASVRFAKDQLKAFVERIEKLEEEKKTISDDIRDVYAESKANGFDVKALRQIIKLRKIEPTERDEQDAILETYMHALGHAEGVSRDGVDRSIRAPMRRRRGADGPRPAMTSGCQRSCAVRGRKVAVARNSIARPSKRRMRQTGLRHRRQTPSPPWWSACAAAAAGCGNRWIP